MEFENMILKFIQHSKGPKIGPEKVEKKDVCRGWDPFPNRDQNLL